MRQNTDRLVSLAKALSKSAQGAKEDTFIVVPPQLLSVTELPGSLKAFNNAQVGIDQFDSFRRQDNIAVTGLGAGTVVNGPVLTPGLWHLHGFVEHHFTGTVAIGTFNFLGLNDVDGATGALILFNAALFPGVHTSIVVDQVLSLTFRAQLQVQLGATIAGDQNEIFTSLVCNKLL